jgi:hypothetical protein
VRRLLSGTALAVAVTLISGNLAWAGTAGRRNTAIAATALAVGAWSNGTGRAGKRNTAILATAGAGVAWKRYQDKKKQEKRRPTVVRVVNRPVYVAARPAPVRYVPVKTVERVYVHDQHKHKHKCCAHPGKHKGWHKHKKHHDDDD